MAASSFPIPNTPTPPIPATISPSPLPSSTGVNLSLNQSAMEEISSQSAMNESSGQSAMEDIIDQSAVRLCFICLEEVTTELNGRESLQRAWIYIVFDNFLRKFYKITQFLEPTKSTFRKIR